MVFSRRRLGDGLVDAVPDGHRPHGLGPVGERLGHGHDVGNDAEGLGGEGMAQASEAADHLVEDEQNSVLVADLAEPLEIPLGRHQAARGAGDGLDEAGGDGGGPVHLAEPLQIVGQLGACNGLALCEAVFGEPGVAHADHARHDAGKGIPGS